MTNSSRQRQVGISQFKANVDYTRSSRTARVT